VNTAIVLVINPGSTSTKLALFTGGLTAGGSGGSSSGGFDGLTEVYGACLTHSAEDLKGFENIYSQKDFRSSAVADFIHQARMEGVLGDSQLPSAVIGRGGLLAPMAGGVYAVNDTMLDDLRHARYGEHASNLGAIIAAELAGRYGCPAFIADPVVVDEMMDEARLSGMPDISRRSIFHALNQKACARRTAAELGRPYEKCNFIVAHMGGGISVGAHRQGAVIDVNNALDGDGPFSPERCGGLPAGQLVSQVIAAYAEPGVVPAPGDEIHRKLKKRLVGRGGVVAYLGENDLRAVENRIDSGDEPADLVFRSLIHQISREIASHGATLKGKIDGIILTGGAAHSSRVIEALKERLGWMAPVFVLPGEGEMEALAANALQALAEPQEVRSYGGETR
jgi:butyrate kinase